MTTVFSSLAIVFILLVRPYGRPCKDLLGPRAPTSEGWHSKVRGPNTPLSILAAIAISASFTGARRPRRRWSGAMKAVDVFAFSAAALHPVLQNRHCGEREQV
jgi:hypothetical protein